METSLPPISPGVGTSLSPTPLGVTTSVTSVSFRAVTSMPSPSPKPFRVGISLSRGTGTSPRPTSAPPMSSAVSPMSPTSSVSPMSQMSSMSSSAGATVTVMVMPLAQGVTVTSGTSTSPLGTPLSPSVTSPGRGHPSAMGPGGGDKWGQRRHCW